jgi:hypothetical protein
LRKSRAFSIFVLLCLSAIFFLGVRSEIAVSRFQSADRAFYEITSALKLTDISFSNDARYTRHPSQADIFSAFQDYPGSIEHFPSGSVTPPPDFGSLGTAMKVKGR